MKVVAKSMSATIPNRLTIPWLRTIGWEMKGEINCAKNVTELKTPIVFAMCCLLAIASRQEELLTITIPPPDPTSNKPNDIEIILCSKKISKKPLPISKNPRI